ncbi:hypothetical protein [Corynebacterium sp.]|nr:hypothetical protein [Corynebacterium sp.]MDO5077196.1 hypothetical protein [Corynebacterium sp.]
MVSPATRRSGEGSEVGDMWVVGDIWICPASGARAMVLKQLSEPLELT